MELSGPKIAVCIAFIVIILTWAWRVVNWLWLRPKKLERYLRHQGLNGNSYQIWFGDLKKSSILLTEATSKPMNLSDDIALRVLPFVHQTVKNYGIYMIF